MKRVGTLASILFTVMCPPASMTQTLSVDWKYYGGAPIDGDTLCFYEAKGVIRRPDGHVRVWTECLLLKDLDSIDIKSDLGKKIIENTVQKVARYYEPPIAVVEDIDVNQSAVIAQYEETANIGYIQPRAQIFYELNCSERMLQELSINIRGSGSRNRPRDWWFVPPKGNGASLLKILCPGR
jgi:hypothetical protein